MEKKEETPEQQENKKAYQIFFDKKDFGKAMDVAEAVYGKDSEEWKRAQEGLKTVWEEIPEEEISESPERKITTSEEATEMTRQRRKDFGLEEAKELTQEQAEKLEESIKKLLDELYRYDLEDFSSEIQDECGYIEQEIDAGKDRELAKTNLENFLWILHKEAGLRTQKILKISDMDGKSET